MSFDETNSASLADAKLAEDGMEHLGGGDFAHDVGKVVEALAKVFAHQVAGEAGSEAVGHADEIGVSGGEGLVVAGVTDDG